MLYGDYFLTFTITHIHFNKTERCINESQVSCIGQLSEESIMGEGDKRKSEEKLKF